MVGIYALNFEYMTKKAKMNQVGRQSYVYKECIVKKVRNGDVTIEYRVDGKDPLVLFIASTGRGTEGVRGIGKKACRARLLRAQARAARHRW